LNVQVELEVWTIYVGCGLW